MSVSMLQGRFEPILKYIDRAHRLIGECEMLNFTTPFTRHRLVLRKRIRSQWSISTIMCICTLAYEII